MAWRAPYLELECLAAVVAGCHGSVTLARPAPEASGQVRAIRQAGSSAASTRQHDADALVLGSHLARRRPRLEALGAQAPVEISKRFQHRLPLAVSALKLHRQRRIRPESAGAGRAHRSLKAACAAGRGPRPTRGPARHPRVESRTTGQTVGVFSGYRTTTVEGFSTPGARILSPVLSRVAASHGRLERGPALGHGDF
jgi:hypothetical protein